jgi:hypothetical protein
MARIVLRPIAVEQASSGQQFGPMFGGPGVGIATEPTGSPGPSASSDPSASSGPSASSDPSAPNDSTTSSGPFWVQTGLYSYTQMFVGGKPYYGDASVFAYGYGMDQNGNAFRFDANGNQVPIDPSQIPTWVTYEIPGTQYWPVVVLESGLLLLGSLFLAAIALVWVDRRRPY